MEQLRDRVAVVTGAASGIGRALVERFADEGMRVVAADVDAAALDDVARATGARAVPTDVADAAAVDALADRAYAEPGAVHLVCNNAGVFQGGLVWERTDADWQWVLGVNLWGVIHGVRAFVPRMLAGGEEGHVVNTASLAGIVSNGMSGPYTVSKWAVVALSETLAHDLSFKDAPIGVSVLCPSSIDTRISSSERNRPPTLAEGQDAEDAAFVNTALRDQTAGSMPPADVAGIVVDAVRSGQFIIPTSAQVDEQVKRKLDDWLARRASRALPFD